jgi:gamma-glutamyltranspeptidase/glutathione hydrolase
MVVTDNALATNVGKDILASGGNAVDAAVATAFALAVTYPTAGNIGGGGFAVVRAGKDTKALDFRETAPAAASRDMYIGPDGKPTADSREGVKSAGVPGTVAGLYELHQKHGSKKKKWPDLVQPAITLAREGFVIDADFVNDAVKAGDRLKKDPTSAALYFKGGKPVTVGKKFRNKALAETLDRIAAKGAAGFYEGPTADAIVAQMQAGGGIMTAADLKGYKAKWRAPVEFTYRGMKVASMPPPSSGGVTLAMMCHILEGYDLGKLGYPSAPVIHLQIEAMRRAFAARNAKLGDPDFAKLPVDTLLSDAWANEQRATIVEDRATRSADVKTDAPDSGAGPHTTHFSVVDADGNVVALTTTVNHWFGSGVTVKDGGFILNNEMDDFAAQPGSPNAFGLVQGELNAVGPGKRMLSSMTPTIVSAPDGKVVLVAGAAGGPTIITAVFQEISNVLDFGMEAGPAAGSPRIHMQHLPDKVQVEANGLPRDVRTMLGKIGHTLEDTDHLADAPFLARAGTEWIGVAEPRRKGGLAATP